MRSLAVTIKFLAIALLSVILAYCASKPIVGETIFDDYKPSYETEVDLSTPDKIRQQIKQIGNLNNPENQRKFVKVLIAFYNITRAGLITRDLNEATAREFLEAHEQDPRQPRIDREMDEFNNERGILAAKDLLGTGTFEDEKLFQIAADEIIKRNLRILNDAE